jgi:hypothetical protein
VRGSWLALALALTATPLATAAPAGPAPRPLALLRFRGPSANAVQRAVAKGLGKQRGLTVVPIRSKLNVEAAELELAKQAGAVCAVLGTIEPGRFRVVHLRVVALPGGQVLQEVSLSAPGARELRRLPRLVPKRLASGLETCRALPLPNEQQSSLGTASEPTASAPVPALMQ